MSIVTKKFRKKIFYLLNPP